MRDFGGGPARALFDDIRRVQGRPLGTVVVLMAAGALAEGLGLLTLLPLLALAGKRDAETQTLAWLPPAIDPFLAVLTLFVVLMIARAILLLARDKALTRLETDYDASLRLRAAATLAGRGWPFAARIGQSGMQALLANDVPRTALAIHQGLAAATAIFLLAAQLLVALVLSPIMAVAALALLGLGIPSLVTLARRGRASGREIVDSQGETARAVFTFHAGMKAAMAQGSVAAFLATYRASLDRLAGQLSGFATDLARARARHAMAAAIAAAMIVAAGHFLRLDLPRLLALLVLFARMSGPAQALQQALVGLSAYAAAFGSIERNLGRLVDAPPAAEPAPAPLRWSRIELDRVALHRDGGPALAPVDLTLMPGEWVAVLGPSGVGKTSLLDQVAGLLDPDSGSLTVDGEPLGPARLPGWRAGIAYVGQQEMPLEATIDAALGGASAADKWAMLDLVGLADLVRAATADLDLPLDDRGARLSGGERQRLLIARALLRRPSLLLLDEATAALDVAAEQELIERIRIAFPDTAALLVAHRSESAALCDRALQLRTPA